MTFSGVILGMHLNTLSPPSLVAPFSSFFQVPGRSMRGLGLGLGWAGKVRCGLPARGFSLGPPKAFDFSFSAQEVSSGPSTLPRASSMPPRPLTAALALLTSHLPALSPSTPPPPAAHRMTSPDEDRLRDAKITLIVLLGFPTFAFSCAPWCLKRIFKRQVLDWINVITAFSAVRAPPWRASALTGPAPSPTHPHRPAPRPPPRAPAGHHLWRHAAAHGP